MSAVVTMAHMATAGRIIGENSTYTPDCGRVLYKEAQGDIAQALADLEAATEARVRAELSCRDMCDHVPGCPKFDAATKEEPTDGKA